MGSKRHHHSFSVFWWNFGPHGRQDVHVHSCHDVDCDRVLIGEGRACMFGEYHWRETLTDDGPVGARQGDTATSRLQPDRNPRPEKENVHVKLVDPVGTSEIAERLGVTSPAVCNWITRYEDFPRPVLSLKCGDIREWSFVEHWARFHKKGKPRAG